MFDPDKMAQRAAGRAERQVKSAISGWIFGCAITLVAFCMISGVVVYIFVVSAKSVNDTMGAAQRAADAWDGHSTFRCGGGDDVSFTGVTASLPDVAIEAGGACHVTCTGCTLTAPTVIRTTGGATVTLVGGSITGTTASIEAGGGSHVSVTGTTVVGPVQRSGGAEITGVP